MTGHKSLATAGNSSSRETGRTMVRVDALRKFHEVVTRLGGDAKRLLAKVQIDAAILHNRHAVIPYRSLVLVLEHAAAELRCADFGMRLAAAQGGMKVLGPLEFAMRNSRTLREAFNYCADHVQVYSTASRMHAQAGRTPNTLFFHLEILEGRLPPHPQSIERALLLTQNISLSISQDKVRAREAWFRHEALAPPDAYREYFGCEVRFGQSMHGLVFADSDLDLPIPGADPQIYELSTDFIENHFPATDSILSTRVRTLVERLLLEGDCTYGSVASMLGMHPRTLQRRLHAEGQSVESIKDSVRRDIALRYLKQPSVPLIRIAKMLGYSETSALSRSCYRWFSLSPRQLRAGAMPEGGGDEAKASA